MFETNIMVYVEIVLGVVMFTAIVLALVAMILYAKTNLVAACNVAILINDLKTIRISA